MTGVQEKWRSRMTVSVGLFFFAWGMLVAQQSAAQGEESARSGSTLRAPRSREQLQSIAEINVAKTNVAIAEQMLVLLQSQQKQQAAESELNAEYEELRKQAQQELNDSELEGKSEQKRETHHARGQVLVQQAQQKLEQLTGARMNLRRTDAKLNALLSQLAAGSSMAAIPADPDQQSTQNARLDESLMKSLEHHPDVVAAKAKVTLAESELNAKRFEIAQRVIPLFEERRKLQHAVNQLKAKYKVVVDEANKAADQREAQAGAERINLVLRALDDAQTGLAKIEREMQLFTGDDSQTVSTSSQTLVSTRRVPEGPIVEKIKRVLNEEANCDFNETPISDVLAFFSDKFGVKISANREGFASVGINPTQELLNLNLREVPLRSSFQAIEDQQPELQFVIRDYGILLTSRKDAERRGFVPAVDFARQASTPNRKAESNIPRATTRPRRDAGDDPFGGTPPTEDAKAPAAEKSAPKSKGDDPFG
jgi:hypothetical protein